MAVRTSLASLLLILAVCAPAAAEMTGDPKTRGLFTTGLTPEFPAGADCPGISSPFGSPTRYDGSPRKNEIGGVHSAIDLTLPTGTPLLAAVNGAVVAGGSSGRLVGNYVWLHATPEDSGLPVHLFVRYQHLNAPSPLSIGTRVAAGQEIARSGKTGTTGGHYGREGYPHLHMLVIASDTADFTTRGAMLLPGDFRFLDPLALYMAHPPAPLANAALRDLPEGQKRVAIPVRTADGRSLPAAGRTVWPAACTVK